MRLVEGGSPALGDGEGKGYVEVGDGLAVKAWSVSHGHCMQNHSHKGSGTSSRYGSMDAASMSPNMGNLGPASAGVATTLPSHTSRRLSHFSSPTPHGLPQLFPQQQQQQQRRGSFQSTSQAVAAANAGGQTPPHPGASQPSAETVCVTDSSAYFIRDMATGREVLIFGDVEPDSISVLPRNSRVWQEAAPKIVAGKLAAIFIECSYDNSQSVDRLFGHLTPRFVIQELADLAAEVNDFRFSEGGQREEGGSAESVDSIAAAAAAAPQNQKKRKRQSQGAMPPRKVTGPIRIPPSDGGDAAHSSTAKAPYSAGSDDAVSPRSLRPRRHDERADSSSRIATPTAHLSLEETGAGPGGTVGPVTPASTAPMSPPAGQLPLKGLKVVIIHMKEKLDDGPPIEDLVLTELLQHEEEAQLGCEFIISRPGQDLYF
ncbi:hypothetical protein VTK73DRAFT_9176 [Phialemonium thermophilum]|uniref:Uncharacterized protein n=1 Tax=Phialemonium thermophilum TaxID=223376 RepID=A0ABR3W4H2_9PEZI